MKLTTTLKMIKASSPCKSGYKKLLSSLGKTKADNEPISFITILESNGLDDALWCLRAEENDSEIQKNARLFSVFCARQNELILTDERSKNAIDVAEKFANGDATEEELNAARAAAWAAANAANAANAACAASSASSASDAERAAWVAIDAASSASSASSASLARVASAASSACAASSASSACAASSASSASDAERAAWVAIDAACAASSASSARAAQKQEFIRLFSEN